jgi:hypothetical protein
MYPLYLRARMSFSSILMKNPVKGVRACVRVCVCVYGCVLRCAWVCERQTEILQTRTLLQTLNRRP